MDRFEFVSASASTRDAATGDSKPNCQKTCSACEFTGSQTFVCASGSRERLSRFSARPLFQREGHPIQVFGGVNNFLRISSLAVFSSNTALDGPRTCGAVLIAVSVFGSTNFFKKVHIFLRMQGSPKDDLVPPFRSFSPLKSAVFREVESEPRRSFLFLIIFAIPPLAAYVIFSRAPSHFPRKSSRLKPGFRGLGGELPLTFGSTPAPFCTATRVRDDRCDALLIQVLVVVVLSQRTEAYNHGRKLAACMAGVSAPIAHGCLPDSGGQIQSLPTGAWQFSDRRAQGAGANRVARLRHRPRDFFDGVELAPLKPPPELS